MRIGIDASRAFLRHRTGIEEYSYQVIRHLRDYLSQQEVILYVRKKISFRGGRPQFVVPEIDFDIPKSWQVRGLWAPRFWTQARLSFEMLFHRPDALFVPAHTVPLIRPQRTIVTIHGLEYEFCPEGYGFWERLYMRWSICFSVRAAKHVIAVSENTKRDLMRLYGVSETKISVVYEGAARSDQADRALNKTDEEIIPHFFFVGRLETRKNIARIIKAFEIFKKKTGLPHALILAGRPGHGYGEIQEQIARSTYRKNIRETGYVTKEERGAFLRSAAAFLFPSLYEGFGLPVIEAQAAGVPVITSNTSSLPEIAGKGALLIDPLKSEELAEAMGSLVRDQKIRTDIIEKATRNADRFSWAQCARGVAGLLTRL